MFQRWDDRAFESIGPLLPSQRYRQAGQVRLMNLRAAGSFFVRANLRRPKRRVHEVVVLVVEFSLTSGSVACFSSLLKSFATFGSVRSVRMGIKTWNAGPGHFSSSYPGDSTQIVPPCASMIPRVIGKPNPGPPPLNFVLPLECRLTLPTCPNFSKIFAWFSTEMPMPLSATMISINPGRLRPSTLIIPLSGVNLMALDITFFKA